jgi:hypothetical protein
MNCLPRNLIPRLLKTDPIHKVNWNAEKTNICYFLRIKIEGMIERQSSER